MNLLYEIHLTDAIGIISVIVALSLGIVSILQSNKQIKNSNKQAMFDKRYEIYLLLYHMDELCNENLNIINTNDALMPADFVASCLTNSVYFYQISEGFGENGSNNNAQAKFLSLIEKLKDRGKQAKLLFPKKHSSYISKYFENYADLLNEMKKYDILINDAEKLPDKMLGTNEQKMKAQQNLLQGDLAKSIRNDAEKYKEALYDLHRKYETNRKHLDKYLTLSERK